MKEMKERVGRLVPIGPTGEKDKRGLKMWAFQCDCGKVKVTQLTSYKQEKTKSCGCLQKERTAASAKERASTAERECKGKNKVSKFIPKANHLHPEYYVHGVMKQRCQNKNSKDYSQYGGRGISVCESWFSFENFINDMGFRPSSKHSIDRIDPDGNYEPSNCRWTDHTTQMQNRRSWGKSGYKGVRAVTLLDGTIRYVASIKRKGISSSLGTYSSAELAAIAYNNKAYELYGSSAFLNEIKAD
jgi:hypothetical protein